MMSTPNDRRDGRTEDARSSARDDRGYSRRIDCAERPGMAAAPRSVRGAGSAAEAARDRTRGGAR